MTTRTLTRSRTVLAIAGLSAIITAPAIAGLPEVLDYVPADAAAVIVVDNLGDFDQHFNQFVGAIEMPIMVSPKQALDQLGIGQSLNMDSSAAMIVLSYDMESDDGEFVVLAPTNNFDALVGSFDAADGGGNGIKAFTVESDTIYAKQVGSWAALSPDRDSLVGFAGKAGNLNSYKTSFGASGIEMASSSDVFITINPAMLAPLAEKMTEEFENNAGNFPGADAEQMEQQMEMVKGMVDAFVRDGSSAAFGVRFGAMGVSGTTSIAFKPGTEGAKLFQAGGDSSSLMDNLPAGPFLFAFAVDNSAPIAQAAMEWVKESGMMESNQAIGMGMGALDFTEMHKHMTGMASAAYPNSAGFMGGLFANMITFASSDNPNKLLSVYKDKYTGMNVDNTQLGMSITSTYAPNETQIAGKSADGYSVKMSMGGMGGQGMMFNPMQMIFGSPDGPAGYFVKANGGVYQSFSRNSTMLAPAVSGQSSLGDDRAIATVASNLPENRYAEFYLGLRPILDQVVPFMGMMGMPPIDLPSQMPPIGFGVAARDGGAVVGTFVPAQTIKSAINIAQTAQGAFGGGGGEWDEDDDQDGPAY